MFKGYKTQDQFIDDLYYKWTQAYNSNNKLNNTENYHVSENFSSEIDKALNNKLQANTQVKARDYTPQILVDNGVDNLPMLITQRHIKSTIYTLQEAENLGLPTKNVNYHGLGKDLLIKAIDNLDSPQAIYKTSENNYLVVTEFKDNNGKEIVIPIQINGNGRYNNVFIDENQIKSVYGRNNLNNYINKNNFEQIYKKNEELDFNEGIQYSNVANSSIKDSITPQNENVNTTTKYSMQESEKNSGSFSINSQNNKTWQDYLEKNYKTTGTRTNMQDILVSKATNNNKERVRDILSRNGSFSEQVDKYIADKLPSGDFLYLGETPTVLQNLGLPNNEVILKQSKLKTLMQESNNNTDKLHELPIETIKKIPEAIANPLNILQSSTDENSVVIITDLADANERPIIASIEVNYDGQIGNIDFLSNRLTSAYGKNNYDRFMKTEIAKGNLLYDIDEGIIKELPATRLQSPKGISSFVDTNNNVYTINNSISQKNDSVKSNTIITNNYAQQTQNDTHNNQNVAPRFNFNIRCFLMLNNIVTIKKVPGQKHIHEKMIILKMLIVNWKSCIIILK